MLLHGCLQESSSITPKVWKATNLAERWAVAKKNLVKLADNLDEVGRDLFDGVCFVLDETLASSSVRDFREAVPEIVKVFSESEVEILSLAQRHVQEFLLSN